MTDPVVIIGNPVSPYVRKVMAVCAIKDIPFEIDPVPPFLTKPEFRQLSPLRRIPVWIEGDVVLCDSSIIVQYIEETRPGPSLWPADPVQRAKARYLEEFADTRLFDVMGWKLFFQTKLKPIFFGGETDDAIVEEARERELPEIFDYLESVTPDDGFLFGELTIADLSLAPAFLNGRAAGFEIDVARWPRLAAWLTRVESDTPLGPINKLARALMRTPPPAQRARLEEFGFTPARHYDYTGDAPSRGPMTPK